MSFGGVVEASVHYGETRSRAFITLVAVLWHNTNVAYWKRSKSII